MLFRSETDNSGDPTLNPAPETSKTTETDGAPEVTSGETSTGAETVQGEENGTGTTQGAAEDDPSEDVPLVNLMLQKVRDQDDDDLESSEAASDTESPTRSRQISQISGITLGEDSDAPDSPSVEASNNHVAGVSVLLLAVQRSQIVLTVLIQNSATTKAKKSKKKTAKKKKSGR